MPVTPVTLADLTTETVAGTGAFDALMRAQAAHLDAEFAKNRITGTSYATVYLGSLQAVLQTALTFLLNKDKISLEAQLIEQQVLLAQAQVTKATAEIALINAQKDLAVQQTANLVAEAANLPKQGAILDQQLLNLGAEKAGIDAKTSLTTQQTANAVIEGTVLTAQKCKLDAEFDVLMETKLKTGQETLLLAQKVATEKAQTLATGVDADSVVGKQKLLFQAQTDGFKRDAEQKAAKIMVETWSVRRTTDEATVADAVNLLSDTNVGRAVTKLLSGINA